jgi:long-chain acyl-CoA synthetase
MATATRRYAANPAEVPRGTLPQLFFAAVDRFDKPDALRHKVAGEWKDISHRALTEQVRWLSLALRALGIARGERVAIMSENRAEWAIADWACLCAGAVDVPIYATLPANQLVYILQDSGARAIFVSSQAQLDKVREIRMQLPRLDHVIVFDAVPPGDDHISFQAALERGRAEEAAGKGEDFREFALSADPDDIATILYTSGTTGPPKGVMLTQNNIASNAHASNMIVRPTTQDVATSFLPLSHIFERMVDYWLFSGGCTLAYVASFDAVVSAFGEVKPTLVSSTPRMYEKLYERVLSAKGAKRRLVFWARAVGKAWTDAKLAGREPSMKVRAQHAIADRLVFSKLRERLGGRLKLMVSGGAPLAPEIAKFFYGAGILIMEGYGLTETSPVTNVNTPNEFRMGTVGKPLPGTEIAIADDGEIMVRGPQVMKGYYNNPAATAEAIDEDGWFRTGDVGEIDADGFLRITDRKKDLIVTAGGKNIAPQPIETRAKLSPFVAEAVMLGDRRPYPIMLVVPSFEHLDAWALQNGIPTSDHAAMVRDPRVVAKVEEEVKRKLDGLAHFELPKKFALLDREFSLAGGELTPKFSVKRRVVADRYKDVIEQLYAASERSAVA